MNLCVDLEQVSEAMLDVDLEWITVRSRGMVSVGVRFRSRGRFRDRLTVMVRTFVRVRDG